MMKCACSCVAALRGVEERRGGDGGDGKHDTSSAEQLQKVVPGEKMDLGSHMFAWLVLSSHKNELSFTITVAGIRADRRGVLQKASSPIVALLILPMSSCCRFECENACTPTCVRDGGNVACVTAVFENAELPIDSICVELRSM